MKPHAIAVMAGATLGVAALQASDALAQASAAASSVVQNAAQQAKSDSRLPEWLRRTDISVESMNRSNPTWSIETVQPLYQTPNTLRDTVFFQGRWGRRNADNTINLGLGYRHLLEDNSWLLGVNTFYDMTTKYDHSRLGLGAEAIGRYVTLRTNYYSRLSGEKTISTENGITTTERVLSGYDYELDAPLPYLPWMRVAANAYRWKSATAGTPDVKGDKLTLKANLSGNFHIELGRQDDNYRRPDAFIMLTYNAFGTPGNGVQGNLLGGLKPAAAFQARDLKLHTLDKVRRQNDIVVERKSSGGGGITIGRRN